MIEQLTIPAVIGAALVDAVNPCAFAVLIILMTTVIAAGEQKRALSFGISFTIAIYISYFLIGLGLFSAIQFAGIISMFYVIAMVLAFGVGLYNIKEYFWYGKYSISSVCLKGTIMKQLMKGVTSPVSALIMGFLVSLIELPCTGGPYLVILGLLANTVTRNVGIMYLLLYNLIFVSPLIIITVLLHKGLSSTEKLDATLKEKVRLMHLLTGIVMILIGFLMIFTLFYG